MTPLAGFVLAIVAGWITRDARRAAAIIVIPFLAGTALQTYGIADGRGVSPPDTVWPLNGSSLPYYVAQVLIIAAVLGVGMLLGTVRARRAAAGLGNTDIGQRTSVAAIAVAVMTAGFCLGAWLASAPVAHHSAGSPPAQGLIGMGVLILSLIVLGSLTIAARRRAALAARPDTAAGAGANGPRARSGSDGPRLEMTAHRRRPVRCDRVRRLGGKMTHAPSPGGSRARPQTRRRSAATSAGLTAIIAASLWTASLVPAAASTPPSMTANHGSVNIAIQGPANSLKFYWVLNGTSTWHTETVAGANTTYSAPSMTVNGNSVNIAAMGPGHQLRFYWVLNGTSTWHTETVAGANTTYSAPSMTVNGNSVNIAAMGPGHQLRFYWVLNGTSTWHTETVAGANTTYSAPSMTVNGNSVNIAAMGPGHQLRFYWVLNGTSTWHTETVAGANTTYSAPSMTVNGNSVNIAAVGKQDSLRFYWVLNGTSTWHTETVAGNGRVR